MRLPTEDELDRFRSVMIAVIFTTFIGVLLGGVVAKFAVFMARSVVK